MTERERCETCIHAKPFGGANDNRCGARECEYINRKEAIEIYKKFKWRPTSEKPETDGEYLVTELDFRDEPYSTSAYFGVADNGHENVFYVSDDEWGDTELDDVIAWMPLPAPWKGEYINRKEAIEVYKAYKDIVRCKDCKHYDTDSRTFPCCTDIFGAVRYMEADGFCSKGERKGE